MNFNVIIDWKMAMAIGASAIGIILAKKIEPADAKETLSTMISTTKNTLVYNN